ncbi:hypothetical protein ACOMHN_004025 [Nucella lapillus]
MKGTAITPCTLRGLLCVAMMVMGVAVGTETETGGKGTNSDQAAASGFLDQYNRETQILSSENAQIAWEHYTNMTEESGPRSSAARLRKDQWDKNMSHLAAQFDSTNFPDAMKRELDAIKSIGIAAMKNVTKLAKLNNVTEQMQTIISLTEVQVNCSTRLPADPDIKNIFQTSRNEKLLRRLWWRFRDESGKKIKRLFTQYVDLSNEAIQTIGYADKGAYWRSVYGIDTFEEDVVAMLKQMQPLYQHLHAFVRRRLKAFYGEDIFPSTGHIPAHLFGEMYAQQWHFVKDLLMPYPNKTSVDVTDELVRQNYTARKIFETAEDFFVSLGLEPMPQTFWDKSMLEKPKDGRKVVCHPTAWDFDNGVDFRIKMCTEPKMDDFITAHHEMGHIEYYMLYKNLTVSFREGANPGFHEAVGDTISLSVQTPKHLHQIGLMPSLEEDRESELNTQMYMALQKIPFLPYGIVVDKWRWSVFRGDVNASNYNQAYWDLRCKLQGVSPPVKRTEEDFDIGSLFHIAHDYDYIGYFVSFIYQFQFHKALCEAAGHQEPLHTCDIYNSTAAGDKLRAMLSTGSYEDWRVPFEAMTGQTSMSAEPIMEYFQLLIAYLEAENAKYPTPVGWHERCPSL